MKKKLIYFTFYFNSSSDLLKNLSNVRLIQKHTLQASRQQSGELNRHLKQIMYTINKVNKIFWCIHFFYS